MCCVRKFSSFNMQSTQATTLLLKCGSPCRCDGGGFEGGGGDGAAEVFGQRSLNTDTQSGLSSVCAVTRALLVDFFKLPCMLS